MRFFFPDSQDLIDPDFDFRRERRLRSRRRGSDDVYAHEIFSPPPYDGMLISKAMVEKYKSAGGRFSIAARQRLLNVGVRDFYRLDDHEDTHHLETMGDCGAFSYHDDPVPPWTVAEVIAFYEQCGFDHGLSVDHVILRFDSSTRPKRMSIDSAGTEDTRRQELTLDLAREFLRECETQQCGFAPVGVAQGWNAASYASAVHRLQQMGYRRLALGGMALAKTPDILETLAAIKPVLYPGTQLHLLGISRANYVHRFAAHGATSFDSTSPLRQAFKDARDNYYAPDRAYMAVRVPQVDANRQLKELIQAGDVDQGRAMRLQSACLAALRAYDAGEGHIEPALEALAAYEELCRVTKSRVADYREVLEATPWKECSCSICTEVGIEVILFRGAERNRRRGFHNLYVFSNRVHAALLRDGATPPPFATAL